MARLQNTVPWYKSLVSLCFSSSTFWKIGVLVSMVLFHTLVSVISLFSGYSVTLSGDLRDVDVGVLACTHWQPCICQERGCSVHRGCNMFFCAGHLFHIGSRLQHSEKVGVLVSMVLVLTLLLCSCFSRFTVKL